MKGFIELTDSLDRKCFIKVSAISYVGERSRYRYSELDGHPELGSKDENGEWKFKEKRHIYKVASHAYTFGNLTKMSSK